MAAVDGFLAEGFRRIVASTWWNDPEAPTVPNVWGSENSYVDVE
jgi:hypothetical protein